MESVRLLSWGGDPDFRMEPKELTALMVAARDGNADLVDLLLKYGADPALTEGMGNSAVDWAEKGGHEKIAARLIG
jgi:ankyrin repeat protein